MAFCVNCGQEISEGAKFCPNCGATTGTPPTQSERKTSYAGEVRKCPSCGMEVSSMDAICPGCGYELRSEYIHPALINFANSLVQCDRQIAIETQQEQTNKKARGGWSSWGLGGKIGWVFLNYIFCCIPLIIYAIGRNRSQKASRSTPAATRKASLIENFQIPNDKEAILGALNFIQTKVNLLSVEKASNDTWYWMKLWYVKAQEAYNRAVNILPGDETARRIYAEISYKAETLKKTVAIKRMIIPTIIIAYMLFIWIQALIKM